MEGLKSFESYLAEKEVRDRENYKMRMLERQSDFYEQRIKGQLIGFMNESKIKHECGMRKKYVQLLHESHRKKPFQIQSYTNLPQRAKLL